MKPVTAESNTNESHDEAHYVPSEIMKPSADSTNSESHEKSVVGSETEKPPPYGSQNYWEERYSKTLLEDKAPSAADHGATNDDGDGGTNNEDADGPAAFHSWYFSYEELKPIILPLILGGRADAQQFLGKAEKESDSDNEKEQSTTPKKEDSTSKPSIQKSDDEHTLQDRNDDNQHSDGQLKEKGDGGENDENIDQKEDGWEEASENENSSADGGEEDEEELPRFHSAGLALNGPISVLEIGCGDVPLVEGLVQDLSSMQTMTGADENPIVDRVVCSDYSVTLIDTLKRMYEKKRKSIKGPVVAKEERPEVGSRENSHCPIEFQVADARELPFDDGSFHLIFEKGTMDAMISDPEVGVSNCVKIVKECARVLAVGGCFFLVSHINAQSTKGEEWLDEVIVAGLRKGCSIASWSIEIHGNEQPECPSGDGSGSEDELSPESTGPAVYLIFKGMQTGSSKISLKFFAY